MPMVIDLTKCDGCGKCSMLCPGDIIHMRPRRREDPLNALRVSVATSGIRVSQRKMDKVAYLKYETECWHCGSCRQDCPERAISVAFPPDMLTL